MSEIEAWKENPIEVVQRIVTGMQVNEVCSEGDLGIPKVLIDALHLETSATNGQEGPYHSIPLLNEMTVEDQEKHSGGKLVRFRCMVQDTLEPEYYIAGYVERDDSTGESSIRTLRYSEGPQESSGKSITSLDDDADLPIERGVLNCVSVPGQQPWFNAILSGGHANSLGSSEPVECIVKTYPQSQPDSPNAVWGTFPKGHDHLRVGDTVEFIGILWKDLDGDFEDGHMNEGENGACGPSEHEEEEEEEEEEEKSVETKANAGELKEEIDLNKNEPLCSQDNCGGNKEPQVDKHRNVFRLHAITHRMIDSNEVLAKFHNSSLPPKQEHVSTNAPEISTSLKVLVVPSSLLSSSENQDESKVEVEAFMQTRETLPEDNSASSDEFVKISYEAVRKAVLSLLKWAAFGDEVASKFLLLNILSKVYERKAGRCMGRFNLALTQMAKGVPDSLLNTKDRAKKISERFERVLSILQPKLVTVGVSLNSLNEKRWAPVRLPENDFMQPAKLQLSQGTHLVLNELDMGQGTLENNGVLNVRALGKLLKSSVLTYDFIYSEHDLPLDITTLALAESNAFLPSDVILPLQPSVESGDLTESAPKLYIETLCGAQISGPTALGIIRKYLVLSRDSLFEMTADQSQMVQETIVRLLQNGNRREVLTEEHFHIRLTIARLLAQSLGEPSLGDSVWADTHDLCESLLQRQEQAKASKTSGSGL